MAKTGRPTKFKPEYCQKMIEFFNVPTFIQSKKTFTTKNGTVIEEPVKVLNLLPTFERFAENLEVTVGTMLQWKKQSRAFSQAYTRAEQMQKDWLVQGGVSGIANPIFTKFCAINMTDMRDKTEVNVEGFEAALGKIQRKKPVNK